jgi:cysteine synthase A
MPKIYNDITEMIGNTPLVRLNRTAAEHGALAQLFPDRAGGAEEERP